MLLATKFNPSEKKKTPKDLKTSLGLNLASRVLQKTHQLLANFHENFVTSIRLDEVLDIGPFGADAVLKKYF